MNPNGLFDLSGKTAAVIGGGSGIGEAVAIGAARQGAGVVVLDANEAAAQAVAARIPGADAAMLDIADASSVNTALDAIARDRGRIDIVICTPSINVRKSILHYTGEEFDRVVAVNLKGSFNVLQAAGRLMTAQRGGSMVFFSSIRAQVVEPGQSVYAMTKAGIVQLVRTGAAEFGPFNVRVNAVAPGIVDTPMYTKDMHGFLNTLQPAGRIATTQEIVDAVLYLSDASFTTGIVLPVDGGMSSGKW